MSTEHTRERRGGGRVASRMSKRDAQIEEALRAVLSMHTDSRDRWDKLIARGAHDNEIWHALKREFGAGGGSQTESGVQFAYADGGSLTAPPKFWIDTSNPRTAEKPTVSGKALVARVRDLFSIPQSKREADYEQKLAEHNQLLADEVSRIERIETLEKLQELKIGLRARGKALGDLGVEVDSKDWNAELWRVSMDAVIRRERALKDKLAEQGEGDGSLVIGGFSRDEARAELEAETGGAGGHEAVEQPESLTEAAAAESAPPADQPHEFTPREQSKTICAICHQGRRGKQHRAWAERQTADTAASGDAPGASTVAGDRGCGGPCQHTDEEHAAFDLGVKDGERGVDMHASPYTEGPLREAWQTGHSVGEQNRRSTIDGAGDEVPQTHEDSVYADETDPVRLLVKTEEEQRGRFIDMKMTRDAISTIRKSRRREKLEKELEDLTAVYEGTYGETADAFTPDIAAQMRRRVEEVEVDPPAAEFYASMAPLAASGDVVDETPATEAAPATADTAEAGDAGVEERAVFTKEVEVELNDSDIATRARAMSLLDFQIEELLAEKKKTDDTYKAKIGGLVEQRAELSGEIRRGRATQETKVFERRDYGRKVVETVREDSGAVVETRPMRPREMQPPLITL